MAHHLLHPITLDMGYAVKREAELVESYARQQQPLSGDQRKRLEKSVRRLETFIRLFARKGV